MNAQIDAINAEAICEIFRHLFLMVRKARGQLSVIIFPSVRRNNRTHWFAPLACKNSSSSSSLISERLYTFLEQPEQKRTRSSPCIDSHVTGHGAAITSCSFKSIRHHLSRGNLRGVAGVHIPTLSAGTRFSHRKNPEIPSALPNLWRKQELLREHCADQFLFFFAFPKSSGFS